MGIPAKDLIGRFGTGRCRNCQIKFPRNRKNQKFCKSKCTTAWHNNGKNASAVMKARVREFCRSEEFKKIVRNQVAREIGELKREIRLAREINARPRPAELPLHSGAAQTLDRNSRTLPGTSYNGSRVPGASPRAEDTV
jgi:hypothetical protein